MPNNDITTNENIDWITHGTGHNCDEHSCKQVHYQQGYENSKQFFEKFGNGKISLFIPSHLERFYQSRSKQLFDTVINTFKYLANFFPRNVQGPMDIDLSLCQTGDHNCTPNLGNTLSQQSGNTYTTYIQVRHVSDWQQLLNTLRHESDHAWRQQNYQKAVTGTLCEGLADLTEEGPCSSGKINFSRNQRNVPLFSYIFDDNHGGDSIKLYYWGYFVAWYFIQTLNQNEFNKLVKLNANQIADQYKNHHPAFVNFFNNIEDFCQQNPNIQLEDVIKWAEKNPSKTQITSRNAPTNSQNNISVAKNTIKINGHILTAPFEIIVHGMHGCSGCGAAKSILKRHRIKFQYTTEQTTEECNGKPYPYVPKIFINNLCLTGDELEKLERSGKLAQLAKIKKFSSINSIPINTTNLSIKNRTVKGREKVKIIGSAGGCGLCAQTKKILEQNNIQYTYYLQTKHDPTPGRCNDELDVIPKVYFGEDPDSPCVSLSQLKQLDADGRLASFAKLQKQNSQSNSEVTSAAPPSLSFGTPEDNSNWQRIYLENNPELSELISNPNFHLHLELNDGSNDGMPMTHEQFFSNTTQFAIIKYAIEQNQLQLDIPEQNYLTLKGIDAHAIGANQICWDASNNKHYLKANQWFSEHNHGGQSCLEGLEKALIESLSRPPLKETIELLKTPFNNQNNPIEITPRIQPGADQPVTATTQKPVYTQRPVIKPPTSQKSLQVVSEQTMNKMKDILQSSDDPYLQDIAKFQRWQDFKTVLDLQPAPISELITSGGKPFATLVIEAKCPPLLLEEMIRRDLSLDTPMIGYLETTRDYILNTCQDITTHELLDKYQSHNHINYDTPAFNSAIEEERLQTLKNLKQLEANLVTTKEVTLAETLTYQTGEGIAQGFVSFLTTELTQYLEKRFSQSSLLKFWLPHIASATLQSALSLMRYPILQNTFWQNEEESSDSREMLEALSIYFFSTLATGIAINMAITKTKDFIEKKYGATTQTSKVLNFMLPYLAALANLPSVLLSQSTYTDKAIALIGFSANFAARGTAFVSIKWIRDKCCPASHSTTNDEHEMQTLNGPKQVTVCTPAEISPFFAKNNLNPPSRDQDPNYATPFPDKSTSQIARSKNILLSAKPTNTNNLSSISELEKVFTKHTNKK